MQSFEKEYIDFSVEVSKNTGMDSLMSKITSILFLEPRELSMEDLAERTGYSLASIHNKMKFLEKTGHIKRIIKPGSKKIYYYMEKDIIKMFGEMMETTYHARIEPAKEFLPALIEKYKNTKMNVDQKAKFDIIANYYKQLLIIEKVVEKLHAEFAKACQK